MNNSTQILLSILFLVVSLATGYWFYNNFAWVEEEKEVGFQGIAKTNKLLAAEFFLRKMGIPVRQVNGLVAFRDLPSPEHTLLIATQRETLNKELSQKLLTWVRSGGHLIVEARFLAAETEQDDEDKDNTSKNTKPSSVNDPLLEELFVFSITSKGDEDSKDIPVKFSLPDNSILVNFPYQHILQSAPDTPPPVWLVEDELGTYLMQFSLGQGLLTVLSSTVMFSNDEIAKHEHARFLHYLTQQQEHNAGVWLIRADDMPALWEWLWDNAGYTMLCLSILFLLWLWRAPLRFGPQLNDRQTERRS